MTGEGDRTGPSKPSMLVPNDFCEIFAAGLLVEMAAKGETFYGRFPPKKAAAQAAE